MDSTLDLRNEERKRVLIPSLRDDPATFKVLFRAYNMGVIEPISLDFSQCKRLSHAGIAFLCGSIANNNGRFWIDWSTVPASLFKKFNQNFSWLLAATSEGAVAQHSVPPRMFAQSDAKVVNYLSDDWLAPGWVKVTDLLKDALAGRTYEIFANAWEHSGATHVYCCGEHSKRWNRLKLAIVDFGVGIPGNVRPFVSKQLNRNPSDIQCLRWALQEGATTTNAGPRGLGLKLLRDMVDITDGQLDIYSHSAHARVKGREQTVSRFDQTFEGTLVNIMFRCDKRLIGFASEFK